MLIKENFVEMKKKDYEYRGLIPNRDCIITI